MRLTTMFVLMQFRRIQYSVLFSEKWETIFNLNYRKKSLYFLIQHIAEGWRGPLIMPEKVGGRSTHRLPFYGRGRVPANVRPPMTIAFLV